MAHPVGLLRHQVAFEADQVRGCLCHLRCRQLQRRRIVLQGSAPSSSRLATHAVLCNAPGSRNKFSTQTHPRTRQIAVHTACRTQ